MKSCLKEVLIQETISEECTGDCVVLQFVAWIVSKFKYFVKIVIQDAAANRHNGCMCSLVIVVLRCSEGDCFLVISDFFKYQFVEHSYWNVIISKSSQVSFEQPQIMAATQ